ncbi:TPA: restriction endonuclease subunit S [Pseudomonas aeruginosa]|uniref:restriction endonuclease subunit S n=1 Tax=Pseudomonas aeruginosa TaxID=287 RepID=UPI001A2E5681|nr:restriction endonuclease subunit S [Pseudomonas aeruginosa]MCS8030951.1 restriction endonuclease subunit S [Pseudomonas aeruginosa]HBO0334679.1 restriction endonuclease subunit S [Pseudomonas aeruginosa]HCF0985661.1 restriction endonuclease subunit S [Pseudomonas aeruginosa]HEH6388567.1 restriction endonuclease subunit S [Pseudomonas aeruginosa]
MTTFKPLRELVTFRGGGTPSKQVPEYWDGDIPWASVKDFTSTSLSETQDFITQEGLRNSSANLIPKGHVIIPTRMSLGKAAINAVDLAINQDLRALIPKVPLDANFLLHAVLSLKEEIVKKGSGATVKGITQEELYKLEIPIPEEFEGQIRIAYLLGKIEGLIAQRKQHLQQLDDLLKSVFLEMFGDPVRNERGWDKTQFSELLADIESGKSPKCEARQAEPDEWGVLKLGAVTRCKFDEAENKALPKDVSPSVRDEVKAGDLLFSRKNTYELVAACAYVFQTRPKLLMPDLIFRFVFKQGAEINPIFIWKLLTCDSQRKAIQSLAAGAAGSMPNISKANLKTVRLITPPVQLQNEFASIVGKVEDIKSLYQQSLTDLEALYGALSQQAFKGELDLSRVALPAAPIEGEKPVAAAVPAPITVPVIELPETDLLPPALQDRTRLAPLLRFWLEAYRTQLGSAAFFLERFIAAAQARLAELHPDNDFAWTASDYESIKTWVFEALAAGALTQAFEDDGNRIELKAVAEHSLT